MSRPVIIAAGGTGGHVIPALAVADQLALNNVPVIWFGTKAGLEAKLVPDAGLPIRWINVAGLRGKSWFQTLLGPLKLLRACFQSAVLIVSIKPRAVLGMGGFVSGPVGIASILLRKPLILHEQNAISGLTNRYLSRFAQTVFSAWPDAFQTDSNVKVIGNPVRNTIAKLSVENRLINLDTSRPINILVVGGSRGASALNAIVPQAIQLLESEIHIVHQTGTGEFDVVKERYQNLPNVKAKVCAFIDDMAAEYQQAELVICRSGAMTVTELSALGLPSVLVPFPFAVDDHQTKNAQHLSRQGAALLAPQSRLSPASLAELLRPLIDDRSQLQQMSDAARSCFMPHAAQVVAKELIEVSN